MGGGIDYENSYEEWEKEQNFKILAALLEKISEEDLRKIFERDYCPIIDVMEARDWQLFWKKINIDEVPKLKEYLSLKKGDFKDLSKKISNPKEKLWVRKMALKLFKGEVISDIRKGDDPRITTIVLDEVKRLKEELHKENSSHHLVKMTKSWYAMLCKRWILKTWLIR